jgi:hypothetical protein
LGRREGKERRGGRKRMDYRFHKHITKITMGHAVEIQ